MDIAEAKDILLNIIADEVIGTYCIEIQKEVDCSKYCENEDCYLIQAIETVLSELEKKDEKIEELKADNSHQWEERCKLTFELEKKDTEIIEAKEANRQLSLELEKKEAIINEMAKDIKSADEFLDSMGYMGEYAKFTIEEIIEEYERIEKF